MEIKRITHIAIQIFAITAIAILLSRTAIYSITSVPAFNSSVSGGDFKMSDVYNSVINNNSEHILSTDIAIVNVDDCSRLQIAEVLKAVNDCDPVVIALDVFFPWQYAEDEILIDAIRLCNNIVLPCRATYGNDNPDTATLQGSYFYDETFHHYGIVNFESYAISSTIREFRTTFDVDGKLYNSMPVEISLIAEPDAYAALMEKGTGKHTISYPIIEFETISAQELLESNGSLSSFLGGKIVFVGDLYDGHDFHVTPIDKAMPGVKIQAYTTQTILSGNYTRTTSGFVNWVLAILTCMLFITLNFVAKYNFPNVGKIVLRLLQVFCLYLFYIIGCRIFATRQLYIDFMPALTMMALGLFAYDVWVGGIAVAKAVTSHKKKRK